MKRTIIQIDEAACTGCGLCVDACHEGALGMVGGKARLLRDDYCDGFGDCLPACPAGAITFVEREAAAYDAAAVAAAQAARAESQAGGGDEPSAQELGATGSALSNWPVQIKLAPAKAPYFDDAHLLVAADCTAFACGDFHERFMRGAVTLVGCPKLDAVDYTEKLALILAQNDVRSVTLARMTVPCCGGLERALRAALEASGKHIGGADKKLDAAGRPGRGPHAQQRGGLPVPARPGGRDAPVGGGGFRRGERGRRSPLGRGAAAEELHRRAVGIG